LKFLGGDELPYLGSVAGQVLLRTKVPLVVSHYDASFAGMTDTQQVPFPDLPTGVGRVSNAM
jgi:hypothetical protein